MTEQEQIRLDNIADTNHEIFALLKQRYSPRTFREGRIKKEHLKQLFEAVRWAASSDNEQPWRFIYAERGSGSYEKMISCLSPDNKAWASNAPVLLMSGYKESTSDGAENFHALHDLGLGMGNLTIQAQYLGIGVHFMAGFDWEKAQTLLKVPQGYHLTCSIALGYYGGDLEKLSDDLKEKETSERIRMPLEEFAFHNTWKNQDLHD